MDVDELAQAYAKDPEAEELYDSYYRQIELFKHHRMRETLFLTLFVDAGLPFMLPT